MKDVDRTAATRTNAWDEPKYLPNFLMQGEAGSCRCKMGGVDVIYQLPAQILD